MAGVDHTLQQDDYRLRTDRNGFISNGSEIIESANNIVVLGDSVVECMFIHEDLRVCAVTENYLRSKGMRLNVLNAGKSGTTTLSCLNQLLNKIIPLRPSMIVLLCGILDITVAVDQDGFWTSNPNATPIEDPVESEADIRNRRDCDWVDRTRLLRIFGETCQAFDIDFALATVMHRPESDPHMSLHFGVLGHARAFAYRTQVNENTREFAKQYGAPLLDLERTFRDRPDLTYDAFHLNADGADAVGKEIGRFVENLTRSQLHSGDDDPRLRKTLL